MNPSHSSRTSFITLLFALIAMSTLNAQLVNLQFVSFPQVPGAQPLHLQVGEEEYLQIEAPTNRLSRTYKVKKLGAWVLGHMETANGDAVFKRQGQVNSTSGDHQIVLIIRSPGEDGKIELMTLDRAGDGLAGGEFFIMNFSKAEIGGVVGNEKFALKGREHIIISPEPDRLVGERKFAIATLFFKKGEQAEPFFTKQWRLSENANSMVFLYHDPNNDRLRLHTIRNFLP